MTHNDPNGDLNSTAVLKSFRVARAVGARDQEELSSGPSGLCREASN